MNQATEYSPYKLLPHPLNSVVYGREARDLELEKSIGENGILQPVDVVFTAHGGVEGLYVLSGHRRVEAAKAAKCLVPVRLLKDMGELWQQSYLLESNRQRVKTAEQRAREFRELERIENVLAESRRAEGIRETGTASQRAATAIGATDSWARKMAVIVAQADNGNPLAIEGLAQINAGKAAAESVFRILTPREADEIGRHYDEVAARLQMRAGFYEITYAPRNQEPQHGFMLKRRFVCEEECEAFLDMLSQIPEEARHNFARVSASWQK